LSRLKRDSEVIADQRQALAERGLSEEEVNRGLGPLLSFRAQLEEEVEWYERARRREFSVSRDVRDIGQMLIALRIANGLTQRELAEKLGVSEAQVSRDERNEYHGITVERAQRILNAMQEALRFEVEEDRARGDFAPRLAWGEERQRRVNEAAQEFADVLRESYEAVADRGESAYKLNAQLTEQFFNSVVNNLQTQAEANQQISQGSYGPLMQETVQAYMDFLNSMFAISQEGPQANEEGSQQTDQAAYR